MISKKRYHKNYFGPRALFIPPKILFRNNEELNLYSILNDSLVDNFCINILYQGVEGIGKKVIINKVIRDLLQENESLQHFHKISIDCKEKSIEEIIISIIFTLSKHLKTNLEVERIILSTQNQLWSLLKLLSKKSNHNLIFVLNNAEFLDHNLQRKILTFGKNSEIPIISTSNRVLNNSDLDLLSFYDLIKKLRFFTYSELFEILNQRVSLSFSHQIDRSLIEIITDLIFENFVPIPGKGIALFRNLFPLLKSNSSISQEDLVKICENQFDDHIIDEFSLLTYLSEEYMLTMIYLDNIVNYFISATDKYYISLCTLKDLYYLSCESLEYDKKLDEFYHLINIFKNLGIISESKKQNTRINDNSYEKRIISQRYFICISPIKLKAMIDTLFGQYN